MQDLVARMNAICDAQPFDTTWYVKDLKTGAEADRGGDVVTPSASTRKTSILMHALSKVHEGKLKLDDPCTIEARLQEGVDSNMVDGIMDWRPGTALAAARLRGLPAFASGSAYVPSTGVALVHEGERILPAADNAALMRLMTGGGGDALATEMRKMREELSFALAAIASHTNKSARILDQFDVDGMPAVRT